MEVFSEALEGRQLRYDSNDEVNWTFYPKSVVEMFRSYSLASCLGNRHRKLRKQRPSIDHF